ncbi:uncharacterized protein LOC130012899 [Patella vulgata]|uniref:uncharacterized protein LOC130012899 n=1 Tax=Patella vulgata TaxID=6465 RepID=UPI0024A9963D|nr:uncharacterized protein LOC130012899 [Patella vulgata]
MEKGGTSNSPSYQTRGETFQVNLIDHELSEDTDAESEIHVIDDVAHFKDTEKQGLAFKDGLEGYVLSIRTDISDTDSVYFKLSQDDGSAELVSDYKIVLNYGNGNMIIYHIPNMIIDNLQPGPTVVHIDTGKTYKCRAGVVRSHDEEDVIVHTNIQKLPDVTVCKIIFGDSLEVPCSEIRKYQDMEYSSLFVKTVDIPNSVNLLTLEQWMKQLNIPQLCDNQDNHSYQYSDKFSGEKFWINLINNGNNDDIDLFSNNMLIDIKMNARNFEINDRECLAFKSGSHAYVSAKAKIYAIDNMCFKLCNDDGSDELITDHKIVLICDSLNMVIYHIPNMIIDNLETGPTIVHIDAGQVYKYRAGVVQGQDDEHIIVHTCIQDLPDASKCTIIFDDNSIVPCCGVTKHQQCSSLLMKMVEIPALINLLTVDQWMNQFNITQEEDGNKDNPSYQRIYQTTGKTFQVNLIENKLSEGTDAMAEQDVVICVVDDAANFNDTEKQGLAFKHGLEGYVLSIRSDISDTDSVYFKLSQDDGSCELVSDYKIVLNYGSGNMIIYHIPNMIIDELQPGPTVVHIDTGATYKCRAGLVRSHDEENVIVHTNIQKLPDATMCKIIFGDSLEVPCSEQRKYRDMKYSSLIVKSAEIPNSFNLLTLEQWMKQLNIPQNV